MLPVWWTILSRPTSTVNVKMRKLADLVVKWIFYDQKSLLSYLFIVLSIAAAHLVPSYEVLHQCAWAWSDVFSYMVCWWLLLLAYSYPNQWKLMKVLKSRMSYVFAHLALLHIASCSSSSWLMHFPLFAMCGNIT